MKITTLEKKADATKFDISNLFVDISNTIANLRDNGTKETSLKCPYHYKNKADTRRYIHNAEEANKEMYDNAKKAIKIFPNTKLAHYAKVFITSDNLKRLYKASNYVEHLSFVLEADHYPDKIKANDYQVMFEEQEFSRILKMKPGRAQEEKMIHLGFVAQNVEDNLPLGDGDDDDNDFCGMSSMLVIQIAQFLDKHYNNVPSPISWDYNY